MGVSGITMTMWVHSMPTILQLFARIRTRLLSPLLPCLYLITSNVYSSDSPLILLFFPTHCSQAVYTWRAGPCVHKTAAASRCMFKISCTHIFSVLGLLSFASDPSTMFGCAEQVICKDNINGTIQGNLTEPCSRPWGLLLRFCALVLAMTSLYIGRYSMLLLLPSPFCIPAWACTWRKFIN